MSNSRRDKELNHGRITDAFAELLEAHGRTPTTLELARKCKLSTKTIDRHLSEIVFTPLDHPLGIVSDKVLAAVTRKALQGDMKAAKLHFQLIEGWNEKQSVAVREYLKKSDPGMERLKKMDSKELHQEQLRLEREMMPFRSKSEIKQIRTEYMELVEQIDNHLNNETHHKKPWE